jgi:hypothetical protein
MVLVVTRDLTEKAQSVRTMPAIEKAYQGGIRPNPIVRTPPFMQLFLRTESQSFQISKGFSIFWKGYLRKIGPQITVPLSDVLIPFIRRLKQKLF